LTREPVARRARKPLRHRAIRLLVTDRFRPRTDRRLLARAVEAALDHAGRRDLEVSLLLTGDAEISRLHREFLGDATPTDVISFEVDGTIDVVVSIERARAVARRLGHPIRAEVALYVVHGVLHGCGYDDTRPRQRARMRAAECAVLASLGLAVTPVDRT
jgi:probable rRNA maturation factor